jgi:Domain of unknown function (DUF4167)
MQNGPRRPNHARPPRPKGSFNARPQHRWTSNTARPMPKGLQTAQRNYERYMELARAEALAGNTVGAESYFQHAEHYFRVMNDRQETT